MAAKGSRKPLRSGLNSKSLDGLCQWRFGIDQFLAGFHNWAEDWLRTGYERTEGDVQFPRDKNRPVGRGTILPAPISDSPPEFAI
jgi:hypothetical protein